MIIWTSADDAPPEIYVGYAFSAGIEVSVEVLPTSSGAEPALKYSFITGDATQAMAPSSLEWRIGKGINTGRNVLEGADYLLRRVLWAYRFPDSAGIRRRLNGV